MSFRCYHLLISITIFLAKLSWLSWSWFLNFTLLRICSQFYLQHFHLLCNLYSISSIISSSRTDLSMNKKLSQLIQRLDTFRPNPRVYPPAISPLEDIYISVPPITAQCGYSTLLISWNIGMSDALHPCPSQQTGIPLSPPCIPPVFQG